MIRHSILAACGLATALVGCGATMHAQHNQVAANACANLPNRSAAELYGPSRVTKVAPIERQIFLARAIQPVQVYGAQLYVPAEAGMHEAYLERVLSCHLGAHGGASDLANDPLRVAGVERVSVDAVGSSMRISVVGKDAKAGSAILQRARALLGEGQVTVEQMADNDDGRAAF